MRMQRLFDDGDPRQPRRPAGCTDLVRSTVAHLCPVCEWRLGTVTTAQAALFYLHGFGGTILALHAHCPRCGYSRHVATFTVTPRC